MSLSKEEYDKIDQYLLGELSDEAREAFEESLATNPELAHEVEEMRKLIEVMDDHQEEMKLRDHLNELHKETSAQPQVNRRNTRKLFFQLSVAASIAIISVVATLFTTGQFSESAKAPLSGEQDLKQRLTEIEEKQDVLEENFERIKQSETEKEVKISHATCFPLTNNGLLITNYHVVKRARKISVETENNGNYSARAIYADKNTDVAIIQITDTLFTNFGGLQYKFNNREVQLGEYIYTLGYPKKDIVFGEGSVSSMTGYKGDTTKFQASIPVNPGNSGSPVFDEKGYVIGLIKSKNRLNEGTTYILKSEYFTSLLDTLKSDSLVDQSQRLPSRNRIIWKKKTDKIKKLAPQVFRIRVVE